MYIYAHCIKKYPHPIISFEINESAYKNIYMISRSIFRCVKMLPSTLNVGGWIKKNQVWPQNQKYEVPLSVISFYGIEKYKSIYKRIQSLQTLYDANYRPLSEILPILLENQNFRIKQSLDKDLQLVMRYWSHSLRLWEQGITHSSVHGYPF